MSLEFLAGLLWGVFTHSLFFFYGYLKGTKKGFYGHLKGKNNRQSPKRIGGE